MAARYEARTASIAASMVAHVLQRGNNRQSVFFDDQGRELLLE
jgi:hypothetical protein